MSLVDHKLEVLRADLNIIHKELKDTQAEFSGVLREMQVTMEGLARLAQVGLKTLDSRVSALEGGGDLESRISRITTEAVENSDPDREGKEL